MTELIRTPLHVVYGKYGAKTIDFGGWDLPVQFIGILDEHEAVRTKAGLFDVSHMGEIEVTKYPKSKPKVTSLFLENCRRVAPKVTA